jgi:hypothetical protein
MRPSELHCRNRLFGRSSELRSGQPAFAAHAGRYGVLRLTGAADVGQR